MFAFSRKHHVIIPHLDNDEPRTLKDMAFSIAEMDKLRMEGKPVSNANLSNDYYDGEVTNSCDVPLDRKRGVDLNDTWNASKQSGEILKSAHLTKVDINPANS